jgi:tight adherence protein B
MHGMLRDESVDQRKVVEAIASWTENLRDVIGSSAGLVDAIVSTAERPPAVLAEPLQRLASSLRYEPLEGCLRSFADEVSHPTCDFVVAALVVSARNQARDLTQLLTHLAACTRLECDLYLRIWVSRAKARTSVRIVVGAVTVFTVAMLSFSTGYLAPFATPQGLLVLAGIASTWAICVHWMSDIARIELPRRFLAGRTTAVQ